MRVLCYGVKKAEIKIFEKINEKYNYDITYLAEYLNTIALAKKAKGYNSIIVRANCNLNKKIIDILAEVGVKYILTRTIGYDHIDIEYASKKNIKVASVPNYKINSVAEHVLYFSILLLKGIPKNILPNSDNFIKELSSCTIGIIGLGKIGSQVADKFLALGAKVIVYDKRNVVTNAHIIKDTLDGLLRKSDVVTLHVPYLEKNKYLVDKNFLGKMKKKSILINVSRGKLVDINDLIYHIEANPHFCAALDTFEGENLIIDNKKKINTKIKKMLDLYPQIILTPHISSFTEQTLTHNLKITFDNLNSFCEKEL